MFVSVDSMSFLKSGKKLILIMEAGISVRILCWFVVFCWIMAQASPKREVINYSDNTTSVDEWVRGKFRKFSKNVPFGFLNFRNNKLCCIGQLKASSQLFDDARPEGEKMAKEIDDLFIVMMDIPKDKDRKKQYETADRMLAVLTGVVRKENGDYLTTKSMNSYKNALIRISTFHNRKLVLEKSDFDPIVPFYLSVTGKYKLTSYVFDFMIQKIHKLDIDRTVSDAKTKKSRMTLMFGRELVIRLGAVYKTSPELMILAAFVWFGMYRCLPGGDTRSMTIGDLKKITSDIAGKEGYRLNRVSGKKNDKKGSNNNKGDASEDIRIWNDYLPHFGGFNFFLLIEDFLGRIDPVWKSNPNNALFVKPRRRFDREVLCLFFVCTREVVCFL